MAIHAVEFTSTDQRVKPVRQRLDAAQIRALGKPPPPLPVAYVVRQSDRSQLLEAGDAVKLVGPTVKLTIRSTPPGVRVYKQGKLLGITPLVVQLPRGGPQTLLTLRKAGFVDYRMNVFARQDQVIQVAMRRR